MKSFVEIRNLQKQYNPPDGVFAVGPKGGVNLDIREGEIFSLLGPNGAGKTTVISIISTLLTATKGEVTINGYNVAEQPLEAKSQIGVVPQELAVYPTLSARQNLEFFGRMYGMSGKELKTRAEEVIEYIGLNNRADDRVDTYSGGMKRRVNIGIGLMHRPKMLFLDEPTVAIDPQSRRNILDTVKTLNEEGMTVLYTTHYMEEAEELSHRIAIIDQGEIIAMGTQDELTAQVGEYDDVQFKVSEASSELLDKLRGLDAVSQVTLDEDTIHVMSADGRAILSEAIRLITEDASATLQSVEIKEPDLEAVFLQLTGRALRD